MSFIMGRVSLSTGATVSYVKTSICLLLNISEVESNVIVQVGKSHAIP